VSLVSAKRMHHDWTQAAPTHATADNARPTLSDSAHVVSGTLIQAAPTVLALLAGLRTHVAAAAYCCASAHRCFKGAYIIESAQAWHLQIQVVQATGEGA